ncbi:hypothetical protein BT96DRAFT_949341 [Gymnopus androsaceus JB14]|uniref:Uncharacterized protein n=1 Tax=Gymnopus androsaceus JB14 TaxID=1447944 RepID=A0A6A4GKS4_9AGAR|nr:hypothetical protein BT96DRAFT_949341 [Gymnopus androsaceus JB14]
MHVVHQNLDGEIVEDSELEENIIEISDTSVIVISDSSMELPAGLPRSSLDSDLELDESLASLHLAHCNLNEETVQDSEPEQEAARSVESPSNIIEISDTSVIDVSDSSMELPAGLPRSSLDSDLELDDSLASLHLARCNLNEEIVQDSEPEQEAARSVESPSNVIEISDTSVIDISDSSMELPAGLPRCFLDYDPEADDPFPSLHLSKYPHNSNHPAGSSKRKTAPSSMTRRISNFSTIPAKKPVANSMMQCLVDKFPSDSMSRLLVCVCCDVVWTSRKSVPQKLKHIKACAKKQEIDEDTLVGLIPPIQPKGKGKATAKDSIPDTLYDKVVQDAAPKKRTRRQEVTGTVKDIGETRDAIMQKAQTVIAEGAFDVCETGGVGEHALDDEMSAESSLTPRFGKSRLARQHGFQARPMFQNDGENPELLSYSLPSSLPAGFPLRHTCSARVGYMGEEAIYVDSQLPVPQLFTLCNRLRLETNQSLILSGYGPCRAVRTQNLRLQKLPYNSQYCDTLLQANPCIINMSNSGGNMLPFTINKELKLSGHEN